MSPEKYTLLNKKVGETPLETLETWRLSRPDLVSTPLAYAGRLDPMASGQLLVLIGEECKSQTEYHNLDKEYQVEILFGLESDSGDVLGLVTEYLSSQITEPALEKILESFVGEVEFPYPIFSAKTVLGKPLHTWTMENRLGEITIPTRKSTIFKIALNSLTSLSRQGVVESALAKIELIPPVTDPKKALGNDFRRPQVRESWQKFKSAGQETDNFYLANITCVCSSGTYMRTLAEMIAKEINTKGLAYSIHRSTIGRFDENQEDWSMRF